MAERRSNLGRTGSDHAQMDRSQGKRVQFEPRSSGVGDERMRSFKGRFALAGAISVGVLIPAWAMDTTMMKSGETLFVMPNGQMGSMVVTDQAMINALM